MKTIITFKKVKCDIGHTFGFCYFLIIFYHDNVFLFFILKVENYSLEGI